MNTNNGLLLKMLLSTFILTIPIQQSFSQVNNNKEKILNAINETAAYATDVLLDENGKSRCDYYITENKWYDYEPPWHTGQIIYGLTEAYKITHDKKFLQGASLAGDWWCKLLITSHPKLKGMVKAIHGDGVENIIFATVSDGSAGLFRLHELTKDEKYAVVPTSAGEWMLNNMYIPEKGLFYDAVNPETGEVLKEWSPFWPEKKEQVLTDVSRPNNEGSIFLDMYRYTKNEKYKKVFIELCESLVEKQDQYGFWMDFTPNNKAKGSIHPRFNLWYAESLIDGYELTNDKRYLDAAIRTIEAQSKMMQKDGTFFYTNYLDGRYNENSITGSTTAFLGILWIRLSKLGGEKNYKEKIELAYDWIYKNRFSTKHSDINLRGAIMDTRTKRKKNGIALIQRDVGTSFALRFLCDYYNYRFGLAEK